MTTKHVAQPPSAVSRPLTGIRVLDLTQVAVGPYTTLMLARMGAEIIKVESAKRPDTSRGATVPKDHQLHLYPGRAPGEEPWNRKGDFMQRNRNKLGITLDLNAPQGKTLFKQVASLSDIVVENFRAAVMERQGLSHETLHEVNPTLIYLKLSAQGNTGPERNYGSLGYTMECLGGLASITGYLDGRPRMSNETYPDPVAGILAVGALMAALRRRRKTGQGSFIDLSQREVTTCLMGDAVLDYAMNGRVQGPLGNRDRSRAPQGVYPCKEADSWVAISVGSDEEWRGLCRAMGDRVWASDPRFADTLARWQHQDELDPYLMQFTVQHDPYNVMHLLQAEGGPAGAVLKGRETVADPHLAARGWWDRQEFPIIGREYAYIGMPWQMPGAPPLPGTPAPKLGEHNQRIYCDLLGVSHKELGALTTSGVTSTTPAWD